MGELHSLLFRCLRVIPVRRCFCARSHVKHVTIMGVSENGAHSGYLELSITLIGNLATVPGKLFDKLTVIVLNLFEYSYKIHMQIATKLYSTN